MLWPRLRRQLFVWLLSAPSRRAFAPSGAALCAKGACLSPLVVAEKDEESEDRPDPCLLLLLLLRFGRPERFDEALTRSLGRSRPSMVEELCVSQRRFVPISGEADSELPKPCQPRVRTTADR